MIILSKVKELVGMDLSTFSFGVEKGKILELVNAIGDDNPIFRSLDAAQNAGYEGIPVPLTYLQVIESFGNEAGFEEQIAKLKFNPVKILHGEQEYEYFGEIYAGDQLTVTGKVVHAETKIGSSGGMDFVTMENQFKNQRGELVAISRAKLVHRH